MVVDTVRASLSGSEDSSEHVSAYLRAMRRLMARTPGAAWVLVHHAGWQDGETQRKRGRGSSAWRGNCDATLYLEAGEYDADRGEAALTLKALKVRDGERPTPLALLRRRVTLSQADRDGVPLTSCIVIADPRSRADREASVVAAVRADEQALDLRTLRVLVDHPDVTTSQDRIRVLLGGVSAREFEIVRAAKCLPWETLNAVLGRIGRIIHTVVHEADSWPFGIHDDRFFSTRHMFPDAPEHGRQSRRHEHDLDVQLWTLCGAGGLGQSSEQQIWC